jgi:hypothetical protein
MSCNNPVYSSDILDQSVLCSCFGITKAEVLEELENKSKEKTLKIMKFRMRVLDEEKATSECLQTISEWIDFISE